MQFKFDGQVNHPMIESSQFGEATLFIGLSSADSSSTISRKVLLRWGVTKEVETAAEEEEEQEVSFFVDFFMMSVILQ